MIKEKISLPLVTEYFLLFFHKIQFHNKVLLNVTKK